MKTDFLLPLIVCLILSSSSYSQNKNAHERSIKTSHELTFTPESSSLQTGFNVKIFQPSNKEYHLIYRTGWLLKGLTFDSPVDQFNAVSPFDIRGYQPRDFSSYVSYLNDTSLLQQKTTPIK